MKKRSNLPKYTICKGKHCGQRVMWGSTKSGKREPLNLDGTKHFETCLDAREFSGNQKQKKTVKPFSLWDKVYKNESELNPRYAVVVDCETTGRDTDKGAIIIQIAAVSVNLDSLAVRSAIDIKLKFDPKKADPEALKANHYYEKETEWSNAVDYITAAKQFKEFADKYRGEQPALVVGHNFSNFDREFLINLYKRANISYPFTKELDTLQLSNFMELSGLYNFGGVHKLFHVADCLKIKRATEREHDALEDARLSAHILITFMEKLIKMTKGEN